jgi:hypothetical protein
MMSRTPSIVVLFVLGITLAGWVGYRLALRSDASRWRAGRPSSGQVGAAGQANKPGGVDGACVDFHEAGQHSGETTCVSGRVLRVYTSRSESAFLDFCPNYRDCPFSSVIFASDRTKFGDLNALNGREVEIQGRVSVYDGRPEIVIRDPEQIHVLP